ncbi:MAG: 3-methyl-2-oxobutanoate hydroxymethyltransferase [Chloroflexi bacterium]|nr:3-methyl-2-oxobutanoate hydroxymethyltransferase [Chloroflexota bacterium]MCY3939348.1 3-methyl-2-oxobutanoate hydroxymethyltransferase [Chloroflexota bacterium]
MRMTTRDIRAKKKSGEKLVMVTAYDAPTARIVDEAGVDMILVGDSVGTNVLGLDSETLVTLDDVIHHARAVARSAANPLLVGDLPFMTFRVSTEQALAASARMIQEGRVQAVKLEGGADVAAQVEAITTAGIPVMGHVGLTPQSVNELGGYRAQGRDSKGAKAVVNGALALESAGAFAIVLESIPHRLAGSITERISVPTIGIGAGPYCDGQVQVIHDIAGWNPDFLPRHAKRFGNVAEEFRRAVAGYAEEVRGGSFPTERHSFRISNSVMEEFED